MEANAPRHEEDLHDQVLRAQGFHAADQAFNDNSAGVHMFQRTEMARTKQHHCDPMDDWIVVEFPSASH